MKRLDFTLVKRLKTSLLSLLVQDTNLQA